MRPTTRPSSFVPWRRACWSSRSIRRTSSAPSPSCGAALATPAPAARPADRAMDWLAASAPGSETEPIGRQPPRRVLIIDDDPEFGEALLDILVIGGCEPVLAATSAAAL